MAPRRRSRGPSYYWVDADRLIGGQWPGPNLDWLVSLGITVLVNLTPTAYRDQRFRIHQIPVPEWTAPFEADITRFCGLIDGELATGSKIYVHCLAGCGRTGTMMACYLVYRDRSDPLDAISRVRALRPCSVETKAQADSVLEWSALMRATDYQLPG
jgi:atypical dual specificity phosphatase